MYIKDFSVEIWMNEFETTAKYNLAETCVESITVEQLLDYSPNKEQAIEAIMKMKMDYGDIEGSDILRKEIAKLVEKDINIHNITITHGAAGANHLVYETLIDKNDHVIVFIPGYQQHYSIPEALGAKVDCIEMGLEDGFQPNIAELKRLVNSNTKAICLTNPNNPTGATVPTSILKEIVEIAEENDAYLICDEVYRGLHHKDGFTTSVIDLYDKAISTGSFSKAYSLAGLRLGWIIGPEEFIGNVNKHRDYSTISCSKIIEYLGCIALKNKDKILERNLKLVSDNIKILDAWVNKMEHITYVKPTAGTTAFLKYDYDITSEELCRDLIAQTGVMLVPGSCFEMEGYLRIGYANNTQILIDGLAEFEKYLIKKFG